MRILVLGVGKTGKLVAEVAAERGHSVHVLDAKENKDAAALTPPFVAGFDVIIDFTTPEAVISNMRACLANGARMVVGTTGWYDRLPRAKNLGEAGRAMGINSAFRAQRLAEQGRRWTVAELSAALDGLLELDAVVKGAPGRAGSEAARRPEGGQAPALSSRKRG